MPITKAFILGAGLGTRLRPLTTILPKPLVPVWNEPLIYHALRHCQEAGIQNFAINTHHLANRWQEFFPQNTFEGASVELFHEPNLLETGGGIKNIAPFIEDDSVLVYNGDIITDLDIKGLIKAHSESDNIATLAVKSEGSNCNIAVENNQVIDIRHDLGINPGTHQFTGIYCISAAILKFIPENIKISIIPAFLEAVKLDKVGIFDADGTNWEDIGTLEAYKAVHKDSKLSDTQQSFISPKAVVEEGAKLQNCIVWNDAMIKSTAQLTDCIVTEGAVADSEQSSQILS